MLVLALLILLCLSFLGWKIGKDIFAPFFIVPSVWCVILLLYFLLPHNLFPPETKFPLALILWNISFFATSLFAFYYVQPSSQIAREIRPNGSILNIYVWISLLTMPIVIGVTIWTAIVNDPVNMFRYLRIMNTGLDENIEAPNLGVLNYFVSLAYVLLFFVLLYSKKKWLIVSIILINLLCAFITMAKTTFLCVILSSLYILYMNKILRIKHIVYGMACFIALSFVLQSVRSASSQNQVEMVDTSGFLTMYLLTAMSAFEYHTEPCSSYYWGENTFRFIYALGAALGSDVQPQNTILPFVSVPDETNTYTNMYPFYVDFGMLGVFCFALIYGLLYGLLYKKNITGGKFALIMYSILLNYLIIEFIGEFIFTNLSMELQHLFFAVLPFLITKKNDYNRYFDGHL